MTSATQCRASMAAMGSGLPGMPRMPTGVAFATPAALDERRGRSPARRARFGPKCVASVSTSAPARAASWSCSSSVPTPRSMSAKATARPAPPAPTSSAVLPATAAAPRLSSKLRRKPMRSVLWPVMRPSRPITTVLTAPICAASGDSASSIGTTASLNGNVTLTPRKADRARCGNEIGKGPANEHIGVHQVIGTVDAGCGECVLVQRGRQRLQDIGADQSNERARLTHDCSLHQPSEKDSWCRSLGTPRRTSSSASRRSFDTEPPKAEKPPTLLPLARMR